MNSLIVTPSGTGPVKQAKAILTAAVGASITAVGIIPDGAIVIGIATEVTTALGTGSGTSGYRVGDGSDTDRWGVAAAVLIGTKTNNSNWTVTTVNLFTAAQNIVITADGGNFNGTGVIVLTVDYLSNVP